MKVLWIFEEEYLDRGKVRCKGFGVGVCWYVGGIRIRIEWLEKEFWSEG